MNEEENYTFSAPIFSSDYTSLKCKDVIIKKNIKLSIINKIITVSFASEVIKEIDFLLDDGIVIKTLNSSELSWLSKTESDAEVMLKDKELELYRELIPRLINEKTSTQIKKNFLIE